MTQAASASSVRVESLDPNEGYPNVGPHNSCETTYIQVKSSDAQVCVREDRFTHYENIISIAKRLAGEGLGKEKKYSDPDDPHTQYKRLDLSSSEESLGNITQKVLNVLFLDSSNSFSLDYDEAKTLIRLADYSGIYDGQLIAELLRRFMSDPMNFPFILQHGRADKINWKEFPQEIAREKDIEYARILPVDMEKLGEDTMCKMQQVTSEVLKAIAQRCSSLKSIEFDNWYYFETAGILCLLESNPTLETLHLPLYGTFRADSTVIDKMVENNRLIQSLSLGRLDYIRDSDVIKIAVTYKQNLRSFSASCNWSQLSDDAVVALARNCPQLERLRISEFRNITDTAINQIAQNCRGLRHFSISDNNNISDAAFAQLVQNSPLLEGIYAFSCPRISGETLRALENHDQLERAVILGDSFAEADEIRTVVETCPRLQYLAVKHLLTDEELNAICLPRPGLEIKNS